MKTSSLHWCWSIERQLSKYALIMNIIFMWEISLRRNEAKIHIFHHESDKLIHSFGHSALNKPIGIAFDPIQQRIIVAKYLQPPDLYLLNIRINALILGIDC